jgi:hypothetical protein
MQSFPPLPPSSANLRSGAEADDEEPLEFVRFERVDKLGMEGGRRVGEIAGEVDDGKAEERLRALAARS